MLLARIQKQPGERRMVQVSYEYALHTGDAVASASIIGVSPPEMTADTFTVVNGSAVRFWIDDGVAGTRYLVTWRTTTTAGEEFEDELLVAVREIP